MATSCVRIFFLNIVAKRKCADEFICSRSHSHSARLLSSVGKKNQKFIQWNSPVSVNIPVYAETIIRPHRIASQARARVCVCG